MSASSTVDDEADSLLVCRECDGFENQDLVLICSSCDCAFHTKCVGLHCKPSGDWWCPDCRKKLGCVSCGNSKSKYFQDILQVKIGEFITCKDCHIQVHRECYGFLKGSNLKDDWRCTDCASLKTICDAKSSDMEQSVLRRSIRSRKSRIVKVGGVSILAQNMYNLEEGEPSVFDSELNRLVKTKGNVNIMSEVNTSNASAMFPFIELTLQQFENCEASIGQLVLWMAAHYTSRFDINSIPSLVENSIVMGLSQKSFRCERLITVNPEIHDEIPFISDKLRLSWSSKKILGIVHSIILLLQAKYSRRLFRALNSKMILSRLQKENQIDDSSDIEKILNCMVAGNLLDRIPQAYIDNGVEEQALSVTYALKHMFRIKVNGESMENMPNFYRMLQNGAQSPNSTNTTLKVRHMNLPEVNRIAMNQNMNDEIAEYSKLRDIYLAKHRNMFRDFLPEHVANKLDIIAKSSKVTHDGTGGLSDDSKPWTNPLYAIQDTPPYIQHLPMRSHQLEGLAWLSYMHRQGSPAILGDEMGLGKTLQTIALLGYIKFELKKAGTSLVICPLGVLNTWMEEFKKWCPDLKVVRLHSSVKSERENLKSTIIKHADEYDAVITTYDVVVGELRGVLSKRVWRYVVLDEGHKIKNEDTNISQVIRTIKSQGKLILTGTPLQNNLHELWAMLNYLLPDIFAVSTPFDEAYDISSGEIQEATLNAVHFVLKPFILRRLKSEVEKTLPPRGVVEISIPLTEAQQFWYKQLLQRDSDIFLKLDNAVNKSSDNSMEISSDGVILSPAGSDWKRLQSLMMQLRKCCNHPYLFPGADPHPGELDEGLVTASGKIALLDRLLPKLKARGHRVCLFSQFTATLDIIEDYCMLRRYKFKRIDGSVNRVRRAISIAEFQKEGSKIFIFLMSTRAGGLGITLTAADTVILFDSDWNPMVDLQAMARVHRIGQTKRVAVYRLVTAGTVEQRMVQRAQKKMFLDRVVNRGSSQQAEDEKGMSFQQLLDMFRFGMQAVLRTDLAKKEITEDELENILDRSKYTTEEAKVQHMGAEIEDESTENFVKFNPTEAFTSLTSFEGVDYREKTKPSSSDVASRVHRAIGVNRIESEPRARKSRFKEIDGENILLLNDYELGTYLSVYDVEQKDYSRPASRIRGRKHEHIPGDRLKKQRAGVDYEHDVLCLNCWDGGKLICCDFCPAVYHVDCAGTTEKIVSKGFICPQHSCDVCLRNTGAAGGLLFRCIACPQAFCEDHVPVSMIYVGECKRYKALGQRHPKQAYFMYCSPQCRDFERAITEINEEEDSDDAIAPIKTEPKSELSDQECMDVPLHGKKTHLPKHTIKQKSKGKNKKVKLDRTLY